VDAILRFFPKPAENHFSRRRLEHTRYGNICVLTDQPARIVDDYHSSVIQISKHLDCIPCPLFKMKTRIASPGRTTGFRAFASSLILSTANTPKLGDFVQIEIVGDDNGIELLP